MMLSSFFITKAPIPQNNPTCNAMYFDCMSDTLFLYNSAWILLCSTFESFI